jgi:hypothetical protein
VIPKGFDEFCIVSCNLNSKQYDHLESFYEEIQKNQEWTDPQTDRIVWRPFQESFQWPQTYYDANGKRSLKKLPVKLNGVFSEMNARDFFAQLTNENGTLVKHLIQRMDFQIKPWIKKIDEFDYEAGIRLTLKSLDVNLQ